MFCPKCGQKIEEGVPHICPAEQSAPVTAPSAPFAVSALRSVSASGVALMLTIALSVSIFAKFVGLMISSAKTFSSINFWGSAVSLLGGSSFVNSAKTFAYMSTIIGIIALVPLGLTVAGCYITYLSAKNQTPRLKSTGFVFFKVVAIIDTILSALSVVGVLLLLIVGCFVMSAGEIEDYKIYWIAFCMVMIFANVIKFVSYVGLNSLVSECKITAETGFGNFAKVKNVSTVYAVIKILSVFSAVFTLVFYCMRVALNNAILSALSEVTGSLLGVGSMNFSVIPTNFLGGVLAPVAAAVADVSIAVLVFSLLKKTSVGAVETENFVGGFAPSPVAPVSFEAPVLSPVLTSESDLNTAAEFSAEPQEEIHEEPLEEKTEEVVSDNAETENVKKEPIGILTMSDGRNVIVDQPMFKIGKNAAITDYQLFGNQTISRLHSVITRNDGKFFIIDNDSTNGTFVNGQRISTDPVQIVAGDVIRFADTDMTFDIR